MRAHLKENSQRSTLLQYRRSARRHSSQTVQLQEKSFQPLGVQGSGICSFSPSYCGSVRSTLRSSSKFLHDRNCRESRRAEQKPTARGIESGNNIFRVLQHCSFQLTDDEWNVRACGPDVFFRVVLLQSIRWAVSFAEV